MNVQIPPELFDLLPEHSALVFECLLPEQRHEGMKFGVASDYFPRAPKMAAARPVIESGFSEGDPSERLGDTGGPRTSEFVNAATVADHLTVRRGWVYEHAEMLGARRLGNGPKARLRFKLDEVDAAITCLRSKGSSSPPIPVAKPKPRGLPTARLGTKVPLLPIREPRIAR